MNVMLEKCSASGEEMIFKTAAYDSVACHVIEDSSLTFLHDRVVLARIES
jgi:hypothetical protein